MPVLDPYKPPADSGSRGKPSRRRSRAIAKRSDRSRRDTAHYLTYYQSSLADGRADSSDPEGSKSTHHVKYPSADSTSTSEYSFEADVVPAKRSDVRATSLPPKARMRLNVPSEGGSDRRRMAIVEVDANKQTVAEKPLSNKGSIRARRGLDTSLTGLALVAPPDAAPKTYAHLTPPSTTPLTGATNPDGEKGRHCAWSETVIVSGRSECQDHSREPASHTAVAPSQQPHLVLDDTTPLSIYQSSASHRRRKPATPVTPDLANLRLAPHHSLPSGHPENTHEALITTPDIGEAKDIDIRVAAPVVIDLKSALPFRRKSPETRARSPPSMHPVPTTAPLIALTNSLYQSVSERPPPPRATFNTNTRTPAPPRPPRLHSPVARARPDIEAVRKSLQLPPSVAAALAAKNTPNPTQISNSASVDTKVSDSSCTDVSSGSSELNRVRSVHRREGAHGVSPTTATTSEADKSSLLTSANENISLEIAGSTVQGTSATNHAEADDPTSDITIVRSKRHERSRTEGTSVASYKRRTFDALVSDIDSDAPKALPRLAREFSRSPKRFSTLLSTPSVSSRPVRPSSSGTLCSSRTPSPSPRPAPMSLPRPKMKCLDPPAMFCSEISSKKTPLERCMLYAQKINELYMYDSGLGDWTIETRYRANANRPTIALSTHTITPQPRHTSGGSIISEVTFPLRPDASVATDLSIRTQDLMPAPPPNLPYPSLANPYLLPPRSSSSIGTSPSIRSHGSSSPSTKSGGFFSSLGRKASLSSSKKERSSPLMPSTSSPSPAKLVKGPPPPRVVNISATPSVPGGPRAAPNHRLLRSQTFVPLATKAPSPERTETPNRPPSLSDVSQPPDPTLDPEFLRQVEKLADLLPHADKTVLAAYLRRTGQDVLAIGQYLDDEKNGTIHL